MSWQQLDLALGDLNRDKKKHYIGLEGTLLRAHGLQYHTLLPSFPKPQNFTLLKDFLIRPNRKSPPINMSGVTASLERMKSISSLISFP